MKLVVCLFLNLHNAAQSLKETLFCKTFHKEFPLVKFMSIVVKDKIKGLFIWQSKRIEPRQHENGDLIYDYINRILWKKLIEAKFIGFKNNQLLRIHICYIKANVIVWSWTSRYMSHYFVVIQPYILVI